MSDFNITDLIELLKQDKISKDELMVNINKIKFKTTQPEPLISGVKTPFKSHTEKCIQGTCGQEKPFKNMFSPSKAFDKSIEKVEKILNFNLTSGKYIDENCILEDSSEDSISRNTVLFKAIISENSIAEDKSESSRQSCRPLPKKYWDNNKAQIKQNNNSKSIQSQPKKASSNSKIYLEKTNKSRNTVKYHISEVKFERSDNFHKSQQKIMNLNKMITTNDQVKTFCEKVSRNSLKEQESIQPSFYPKRIQKKNKIGRAHV